MAEQAPITHPELLKVILETNITAVVVTNAQGEIIYANKQAENLLGLTVSSIKKRRYNSPEWKITDIKGQGFLEEDLPFRKVMTTAAPVFDIQHAILWPNGERKCLSISGAPILDDKGNVEQCAFMFHDITAMVLIKEKLSANYDELQMILDAMPALVFYKDTKNNIVRVNRLAAAPKGVSPREMENTPTSRWYPDEADQYYQDDLIVINSGRPKLGIIEQHDISSRKIWVKTDKYPYFDKSGKIIGILVFAIDITHEKETELKLRESEELFRSVFENTATAIIINSPNGNILKVNGAACRFFGYREEELINMNVLDLTHRDDVARSFDIFEDIRRGKIRAVDIEKRYIRKNGDIVWARVSADWILDSHGKPSFGVGMIQDITRRKAAEIQLAQSEERFRSIFEKAALGMALYTKEGKYIQVNQTLCDLLGYKESEMLNLDIYKVTYPDDLPKTKALHREIFFKKLKTAEYERRLVKKNGTAFWTKGIISWVYDDKGEPSYGVSMIQNIEDAKKNEQQMKGANVELERRVAERTAELEQKNTALREVLGQLEVEKSQIEKNVVSNIEELIFPVVEKLKRKNKKIDGRYLDLLEKSLESISNSFGQKLATQKIKLTPKEIEICNMIKNGLSTKEMAEALNLSLRTVENHRNKIRTKLGLSKKKINLTTYISSI